MNKLGLREVRSQNAVSGSWAYSQVSINGSRCPFPWAHVRWYRAGVHIVADRPSDQLAAPSSSGRTPGGLSLGQWQMGVGREVAPGGGVLQY